MLNLVMCHHVQVKCGWQHLLDALSAPPAAPSAPLAAPHPTSLPSPNGQATVTPVGMDTEAQPAAGGGPGPGAVGDKTAAAQEGEEEGGGGQKDMSGLRSSIMAAIRRL